MFLKDNHLINEASITYERFNKLRYEYIKMNRESGTEAI